MGGGFILFGVLLRVRPKNSSSIRLFNKSLFKDRASAVWTLCGLFNDVIRHCGIRTGNLIENPIKRYLSIYRITRFAGFHELLQPLESFHQKQR
jgi:hypothetical protein